MKTTGACRVTAARLAFATLAFAPVLAHAQDSATQPPPDPPAQERSAEPHAEPETTSPLTAPPAPKPGSLESLSLEELSGLEVTSVSGRAQRVGDAPAAIFVITSDDIERAGVRSIPGALRLAPNLQVARIGASDYAITSRGFNQPSGAANKLLVLVDGRPVYTPLFSGVFWDEQNAVMDDLERIEVVSGPGGARWGANAVNGVINVVSRDAHETLGGLATAGASENAASLALRHGWRLGDNGAIRLYGLGLGRGLQTDTPWRNYQVGFRSDIGAARDTFTVQGDGYLGGSDAPTGATTDPEIHGGNVLARWDRRLDGGDALTVQTYADHTYRRITSGIRAKVSSAALDAQYTFDAGSNHQIVLGGGGRVTDDTFTPAPGTTRVEPGSRTLTYLNAYVQDTLTLSDRLDFVFGLKLEHNTYTGLEYLPSARVAYRPSPDAIVWLAVSRSVRTPSRFDRDLQNPGVIQGGANFQSETVTAYEAGFRAQTSPRLWFSLSTYYNDYDDLRTLEATGPAVFPLEIRNGMSGATYGAELWGAFAVTPWWRLNFGANALKKDLQIDAGSTDVLGVGFAGNDPDYQLTLRSLMDLGARAQLDVSARSVAALPDPAVDAYTAVDIRLAYQLTDGVEFAVTGFNLFDDGHVEFINPSLPPSEQGRSVFASLRWRY